MSKRIVFSTSTPNDQGGVIPDNVIDYSRFNKNPVCLKGHSWCEDPIGLWTDIQHGSDGWSGIPVFHGLTEQSRKTKELYEGGWVRCASIGGQAVWKTNSAGQYVLDGKGNKQCVKFYLYEISIVSLPSNEDAVQPEPEPIQLAAKIYEDGELENINSTIVTLSSKYNQMAETKPTNQAPAAEPAVVAEPVAAAAAPENKTELAANNEGAGLPKWFKDIIGLGGKIIFGSDAKEPVVAAAPAAAPIAPAVKVPKPEALPESKPGSDLTDQPTPIGLSAKAKEKAEKAREAAEKAVKKAEQAKKAADADDATDEMKAAYKSAVDEAEEALKAAEAAEKGDDDEEDDKGTKTEKSTNSAAMKPEIKTTEQLRADLKLAAPPTHTARVVSLGNGKTFSQLSTDTGEGRAILNRVMTADAGEKNIADYAAVLNSIMADSRFKALADKVRLMMNVNEAQLSSYQSTPGSRSGLNLGQVAAQLNAGSVDMMGRDNVMRQITTLNSSDDALASPALTAIEWLPLAIFKLFPTSSWKNEIAIFGAQETSNNLGIIWANIAADPAITKGAQPVSPTDYTYNDTAVALKLVPYWLQPMRWTPLTMHQLRYDQMGTGWAQAFAKWGAVMDDDLLYTLASTVPASSIVTSTGSAFNIASSADPNAFYYNPAFTGNLNKPVLNDIITVEQIYNRQNFQLEGERPTMVIDPTMDAFISKDPETKSLLTRWVNADGADLLKFKHTILNQRSRVAIYDPATGQVKDPSGVIPATAVSASVGFIPSQVGMGLGMLDVFMIQDPSSYGYKMSADIRIGIVPLRPDYSGTSLYTYGNPNV